MKNSIIKWFGGKRYLLKHILPFPIHKGYIEPFGGSAVVLLNKIKADQEVYNDLNSRLVNFWQVLKEDIMSLKFISEMKGGLDSRYLFEKYKLKSDDNLEDAFRFLYVNRHSFSGNMDGFVGFSVKMPRYPHNQYLKKLKEFDWINERIKMVHFEKQDFRKLLKRSDRPDTLWYLDPPYFKGGKTYEKGIGGSPWTMKEFEDLRDILKNIKHAKFVLSIDNKEYFQDPRWFYQEVERINRAGIKRSRVSEYIIRNFNPETTPIMVEE